METSKKSNMAYKIYAGFDTPSYQSLRFTELYRKYYLKRQKIKINSSKANCEGEPTSIMTSTDTVREDNLSCNADARISEINIEEGKLQENRAISHKMKNKDWQQKEALPFRKISFKICPRPFLKLLSPSAFDPIDEISETKPSQWRPAPYPVSSTTSPSLIKPKNDASETTTSETIPWDPGTCSGDTTTTINSSINLDNKETDPNIENWNGNRDIVDYGIKEAAVDNNKLKSLSSAGSWEGEEDCPPLASEDSDIGDHVEFESFSDTEDDEEDRRGLAGTFRGCGGELHPAPLPQRLLHRVRPRPPQHQQQHLNTQKQYGNQYRSTAP